MAVLPSLIKGFRHFQQGILSPVNGEGTQNATYEVRQLSLLIITEISASNVLDDTYIASLRDVFVSFDTTQKQPYDFRKPALDFAGAVVPLALKQLALSLFLCELNRQHHHGDSHARHLAQ